MLMRYFFLFFLCITFIFCGYANPLKAEENSAKSAFESLTLTDFIENTTQQSSLLTQNKGIGVWKETPYGKIRLLSRESGTDSLKQVLMVLEVYIKPGTILKNTDLKVEQMQNVKDYRLLTPVNPPLYKDEGLTYKKTAVFPILIHLTESNRSVQISVEFNAQFCKDGVCDFNSQSTALHVPNGPNYFTPLSSFIDYSMKFVPTVATGDQIQIGTLSDNAFWVMLNLPQKIQNPNFLFLNAQTRQNIPYTQIQSNIDDKKALFVFRTDENIQDKEITLFLENGRYLFTKTTKFINSDIPPFIPASSSDKLPFSLWVAFLLLSPCLCLLLQQRARNEIVARPIIIRNIIGIIFGILCGVPIYLLYSYSALESSVLWLSFGFLLFLFLGIFAYPITSFGYGLLTAIIPFFPILKNASVPVPVTFNELMYFFSWLAVLNILPFLVFLIKPYWLVKMGFIFREEYDFRLRFAFFLDAILFGFLLLITLFG